MGAPVVEIADILGQNLRQMAQIEDEYVVQALGPDRSHPALGDRVGPRRSERRASLPSRHDEQHSDLPDPGAYRSNCPAIGVFGVRTLGFGRN